MDLLLHNLRTIGTHHCDPTVGEEAAQEIERLRSALADLVDYDFCYFGGESSAEDPHSLCNRVKRAREILIRMEK